MLIPIDKIKEILFTNNIDINGVLHIGAHDCEEKELYNSLGITDDNIIWIDALHFKVIQAKINGIPNVYQSVITDVDDSIIQFNISNNIQSSSIYEFGTHLQEHPQVNFFEKFMMNTITIDTFFKRNNIDASKYDFWNFDIQGAELLALKGSKSSITFPKVLYLEVNEKELYKNCALVGEIDEFLLKHNFKRVFTKMTTHGWGDAIYIKGINK